MPEMNETDASFSSFLELDLDKPPIKETPLTPLQLALRDIAAAQSRADLERAITPLRAWPEGKDKQAARDALNVAQARIARQANQAAQAMDLSRFKYAWLQIWGSFFTAIPTVRSYKPAFQTDDSGKWYDNAQRFPTEREAYESAQARFMAWTMARAARALPSQDEPNYTRREGTDTRMGDPVLLIPAVPPTTPREPIPAMPPGGYETREERAIGAQFTRQEGAESPTVQGLVATLTQVAEETRATSPTVVQPLATPQNAATAAETRAAIQSRDFVTGAREDGSGILVGWAGSGELKQYESTTALARAGYPMEWGLKSRSAHAHASAAVNTLAQAGRIIKPVGKGRNSFGRFYTARWTVGNAINANVGDKFGQVILTCELSTAGTLTIEGDASLAARVREDFDRRMVGEVYPAGDVTEWFRKVLISRFSAVRLGGNWYVPERYSDGAERLCGELAKFWGLDWILPALPVATTNQLRAGLVRGLAKEVTAVIAEFETQRASARKAKAGSDIGATAAAALLNKLRDVHDRAKSYADLLGSEAVRVVRENLAAGIAVIEPLAGDSAQRFNLMELT